MKKSNYYLIVMVSVMGLLTMGSCSLLEQDLCADITCENGGSCDEGICDCPDGFSGTNCETEDLCITNPINCENGGTPNGDCTACDCPEGYTGTNCENFDATQVQALLANHTPIELVNGGVPIDSLYGKMYKDGLIFYLNTDDGTGMVAATTDQGVSVEWGCVGKFIGTSDEFGDGADNTMLIVEKCTQNDIAAKLCDDLLINDKSDWFLPSIDELTLMCTNLHLNGHGGFATEEYWSSHEFTEEDAVNYHFGINEIRFDEKDSDSHVRAARAF